MGCRLPSVGTPEPVRTLGKDWDSFRVNADKLFADLAAQVKAGGSRARINQESRFHWRCFRDLTHTQPPQARGAHDAAELFQLVNWNV